MDAETNDPASRFSIPEGYTVEPLEDGRLAVYHASTGAWLGYFSPALCTQEMVKNLIGVHEEEQSREILPDLAIDSPVPERAAKGQDEPASRMPVRGMPEQELMPTTGDATEAWDVAVSATSDALRLRELEIVTGLAVEALREAGDGATAEIIRQVLEGEP